MMSTLRAAVLVALALAACAPSAPSAVARPQGEPARAPAAPKVLAIGLDEDLKNLWDGILGGGGTGARELANMVNQHLAAIRSDGSPTPRLLAELPAFDRGTWRMLPDGRMETTWKLRPGVTWHDGTPFTGDDVVFSWLVNRDPDVPNSNQEAVRAAERMQATDPTTVVVTWGEPYPFADRLEHRELFMLPKHLLERAYQDSKEAFVTLPFFSEDFVGVGPYRITRWERGSHMELAAHDGFFLGRPKIDTIQLRFITDPNTMLANLKARSIQSMLTLGDIPEFSALMVVKQDWEATGYGTVVIDPISYKFVEPQLYHSPSPPDLVDPRVRSALLLAINRPELAQNALGEFGAVADSWVHPSFGYYSQVQDATTRYPYDVHRASALLAEAGWRPGADGILERGTTRFDLTMRDQDGERDPLVAASNWKEVGIAASYERKSTAALRDRQDRATFTGVDLVMQPMGVASVVRKSASYNIPTAENRWTGTNRGGYASRAWDDIERRMLVALDDGTRLSLERELLQLYTTDLPLMPLYFKYDVVPTGGGLTGVVANTGVSHRGFILHTWNIHEWDLKS